MTFDYSARHVVHALHRLKEETQRGIGFFKSGGEEDFVTYADFFSMVSRCLTVLVELGVTKGDEVIIQVEDPRSFLSIFWACLAGGMIPVPLTAGDQAEHKRKVSSVWLQLSRPWIIGRQAIEGGQRSLDMNYILDKAAVCETSAFAEPEDIAYIQYSSGSTGNPKGVVLTHANLVANVAAILDRSGTTRNDAALSWMPLTHDMGMICFHMCGIFAGIDQYIMPTALFIKRPLLWLQLAADKKITQLYSPNFGLQFFLMAFKRAAPPDWDLSAIRIIYNGAEQISEKICLAFTETLRAYRLRSNVMFPGYGLAEASVAVTLPNPGEGLRSHRIKRTSLKAGHAVAFSPLEEDQPCFVEVGYPVSQCSVRITHAGKTLPDGYLGDVEIKGANVTGGYYKLPELTALLFSEDGWLKTGDLGCMLEGRLLITGRNKNIIVKNGMNYFPHDLEFTLQKIPAIELGSVVVTSCWNPSLETEQVLVFLLFKKELTLLLPLQIRIRQQLLSEAGLVVDDVIPVRKIPKTTSGKIQHFRLTEAYLSGEYDQVLADIALLTDPGTADTQQRVEKVYSKWLPGFSANDDFHLSGLSSLQLIKMLGELEECTGKQLAIADVYANPTPLGLLNYLRYKAPQMRDIPAIMQAPEQPDYPVLLSQFKMWALEQDPDRKGLFNISFTIALGGKGRADDIKATFRELLRRHESLRTHFILNDHELRQVVTPYSDDLCHIEWREVHENDNGEAIRQEANTPFDLGASPLMRIVVWHNSQVMEDELQVTLHHIVTDGWSISLLLQEFGKLYFLSPASGALPSLPALQLKDYCSWYDAMNGSPFFQDAAEHWINVFRGGVSPTQLPFHPDSKNPSFKKEVAHITLDAEYISNIDALAGNRNVSRGAILVALIHSLFHRCSGQPVIITGVEVANRSRPACAGITGPLINTLLIPSVFTPGMNGEELVSQIHSKLLESLEFETYCFDHLAEVFRTNQIDHPSPLFNALIIYHNFNGLFEGPLSTSDSRVRMIETKNALCDLVFELLETSDGIHMQIHYDTGKFRAYEISALRDSFRISSAHLLRDPQVPIQSLRLLSGEEEQRQMRISQGEPAARSVFSINDLVAAAGKAYPERTAITCGPVSLTYREMGDRICRLSERLAEEYNIKPGALVALIASASDRSMLTMFSIWRAGGIYIPIDPLLPEHRIRYILKDTSADLVITDIMPDWLTTGENKVVSITSLMDQLPVSKSTSAVAHPLACILYTSGTTGYPKGIMLSHDGLADYIQTFVAYFQISDKDVAVQQASIGFDTSFEEMLPVLSSGGRLVIAPSGGRDVHALLDLIDRENVTVLSTTPAVIQEINYIDPSLHSLRVLISGGERLERRHIDHLSGRHFEIYNTYGPAETTICATYNKVDEGTAVIGIGGPIHNREVYILDEYFRLVLPGETGEICIGGRGLAQGYLNLPALTAEKFIPHPFYHGRQLYSSGDMGRWLPDDTLEFIGRRDNQLKIRGYRVECDEVVQVINREGECESAVIPVQAGTGEYYLSAYVAGITPSRLEKLKSSLPFLLPDHMIPSEFTILETIPLNVNGKVDKKRLPRKTQKDSLPGVQSLQSTTQKKLAVIWKEILEIDEIGPHADFLQSGGHSLKIVRLISRIDKDLQVRLSLKDIFEHSVLASMAACIEEQTPVRFLPIPRVVPAPDFELSHAQRRLWVLDRLYPGNTAYNIVVAYRLEGWPGMDRLTEVLLSIVSRYEILRTVFKLVGDHPRQMVLDPGPERLTLRYTDLRDSTDKENAIADCAGWETSFHFNLYSGPLLRVHVMRLEENGFILLFNTHHIISDGWSMEVLLREVLSGIADAHKKLPVRTETIQYKDYSAWQSSLVKGATGRRMRDYWKSKLSGELPVLSLPTDHERPAEKTFRGDTLNFTIDADIWSELRILQRQEHTSMYTLLLAAIFVLLYKESGQKDILLGTATAGRDHTDLEGQIGIFANTLPIRLIIQERGSFKQLIRLLHAYMLDTYDSREYPFDCLIEDLGIERDMSRYPLFDVLVNYDDRQLYSQYSRAFGLYHQPVRYTTSKFDLTFHFEEGEQLTLNIEYALDLFQESTIRRYHAHLDTVLRAVIADPDKSLFQLSLLSGQELEIMNGFNNTSWHYPQDKTLAGIFEGQARRAPDRIAVICNNTACDYGTMDHRATRLAGWIQHKYDVKRGDRVILLLEHSTEMLVAMLAVLKTGATYVPVGIDYPDERIAFVVEDIQPALIITHRADTSSLPGTCFYLPEFDMDDTSAKYLPVSCSIEDAAYIIYTSGSTGDPKGVVIRHFSVINLLSWLADYLKMEEGQSLLSISNYTFDISVLEYFLPWLTGGTLILSTQKERKDPAQLVGMLDRYKPDIFQSTPSLLAILVREGWKGSDKLTVISGGETLQKELAARLVSISRDTYNMYGPTETTIYSSIFHVTPDAGRIFIGRPVGNTHICILDPDRNIQPLGVVGEICISGDGVAAGYYNRPSLNREKFIAHPYEKDEILYLTGDLGRWTSDGDIEFVGRRDTQVKINGYRIECGEVEKALAQAGVETPVVLPLEDKISGKYLAAYLNGVDEMQLIRIKEKLLTMLPVYMMPTAWHLVDTMPLNSNGKADRKLLANMTVDVDNSYHATGSKVQKDLSEIWKEVLGIDSLAPDGDFFRMGGHSIAALKIINAVNRKFTVNLSIKDIFVYSTLEKMAFKLESISREASITIPSAPPAKYYPLSHSQHRLWILNALRPGNPAYNLPAAFRVEGNFRPDVFIKAIQQLVGRHEILRTAFVWADGQPWQRVLDPGEYTIEVPVEDKRGQDWEGIVEEVTKEASEYSFLLEQAPLLNIRIIQAAEEIFLISVNIHHIICDGWSIEIMLREVSQCYNDLLTGGGFHPEPLLFQYKDYSVWQRSPERQDWFRQHRRFWMELLQGANTMPSLPLDHFRPKERSGKGDQFRYVFPMMASHRLRQLAADENASLFMTLLSLIYTLLAKYSGEQDITIGTVVSGRGLTELETQIGFYVNTIPVRSSLIPGQSFTEYLGDVKRRMLDIFQHQEYPLDLMINESILKMNADRTSVFDVVVNYQPAERQLHFSLPGVRIQSLSNKHITSKFDLTFDILEDEEIIITTEFNTDIYKKESVARMMGHLAHLCEQVCNNPSVPMGVLTLPSAAERSMILNDFNATAIAYPCDETVVSLFLLQVKASRDITALVAGGKQLSYGVLDTESSRLCRYLVQEYGVLPGDRVAITSDHDINSILWILAILKAGGVYVPIDIDCPAARMNFILEDTEAALLLTDHPCSPGKDVAVVEMSKVDASSLSEDGILPSLSSEDTVYIMYTSGSTGKPKGVPISHRNIIRLVHSQHYHSFNSEHRLLQTGSLAFDASTFEIWGTLLNGGQLHLLSKEGLMNPEHLKKTIRSASITTMWFTASWFHQLADQDAGIFLPLQTLLVGGDKLSVPHIKKVKTLHPELRIVNGYGPTEATTFTTCHEIMDVDLEEEQIPIGRPIANTQVYILDVFSNPQPVGIIGEICIGGDGLSKGYWKDEGLTREKFVDNPFRKGEKLYRSGDLGCWRKDGVIIFKGRKDHQVKIRGHRVECGEVEHALQQAGGRQVMVKPFQDPNDLILYLAAYVSGIKVADQAAFKSRLRLMLPEYMVPSVIFYLQSFPVNSNGKIDQSLMPVPGRPAGDREYIVPETEMQKILAGIWEQLLQVDRVGMEDNFFELGGHSLKALRLIGLLAEQTGKRISFKDIFAYPLLKDMAARLSSDGIHYRKIGAAPVLKNYPLSFNQYGLWVAGEKSRDQQSYNIIGAYRLAGKLNIELLAHAFGLLIERHESLRTSFVMAEGEIRQFIPEKPAGYEGINTYDWREVTDLPERIGHWIARETAHAFDLYQGPLLRIHLIRTEEEETVLVINLHHIIADGWSLDILVREIRSYYRELIADPAFRPAGLDRQYKDFAYWQNEWAATEMFAEAQSYWLGHFAGGIRELDLSRLYAAGDHPTLETGQVLAPIDVQLAAKIKKYIAELHISHFVFFLSSWNVLLYKLTHQEKFVVAAPVADRDKHLMDQIGYYVNTILINAVAEDGMIVRELLRDYRNDLAEALQYREYPLNLLVEKCRELKRPVSNNVFNVGFSWFIHEENDWDLADVKVSTISSPLAYPKSKLWLSGSLLKGNIQFSLTYDASFMSGEVASLLVRRWVKVMEAFIRLPDASLGSLDIRLEEELVLENREKYQEASFDF